MSPSPTPQSPRHHPITILVADDHVGVAAALTASLAQWFQTQPAVNSLEQLSNALAKWGAEPEGALVVVLDVSFGEVSALRSLPDISAAHPQARFLMHSAHFSEVMVDVALRSGALGYVDKCSGLTELRRAIEAVAAGKIAVYPVGDDGPTTGMNRIRPSRPLTRTLRRVLALLQSGRRRSEIAAILGVTLSAVEADITRLRRLYNAPGDTAIDWRECGPT